MPVHQQTYQGASARDAAAELFAEELAEALRAQAQSMGLRISVEVCGATVLAQLADGGAFRVSIEPAGAPQN
jgi:hypothetical protein